VGVEKRLRDERLFDHGVRQPEDHDRWPAQMQSSRELSNQKCAPSIKRRKGHQRPQPRDRQIAEEELTNQWSEEEETQGRRECASQGLLVQLPCSTHKASIILAREINQIKSS